jgi:cephalosporin-C deacetylase-like acetyl esterase
MNTVKLPSPSSPDLFHDWTMAKMNELLGQGDEVRAGFDADSWPAERQRRRNQIGEVLTPKWDRADPQTTVTKTIRRSAWEIRLLRFQSLADYWVTAALYVPDVVKPKNPAILFACGHALEAKGYPEYHSLCEELTRQGFIVMAFDPVSQGERVQNWDYVNNCQRRGWGTTEHDIYGTKTLLCGWSLAQAFAWDGQRALDVLLSQDNVDADRVGVCGNSGGGTQTTWLLASDDRFAAASPATYITSWRSQFAVELGADPEQWPHPAMAWGWDQADVLTTFAPKPLLIGCASQDFFPPEGTHRTFGMLKDFYERIGASGNVQIAEADIDHGYFPALRKPTVQWFCNVLGLEYDNGGFAKDILDPEDFNVTPTGQLFTSGFDTTLQDHIVRTRPQATGTEPPSEDAGINAWQESRREGLRELLAIPACLPEVTATAVATEGNFQQHLIVPEDGVELPVAVITGNRLRVITIYVNDEGADTGWSLNGGPLHDLVEDGRGVVLLDPRGVGMGRRPGNEQGYQGRFGVESNQNYIWTMMGRPLIGQRVIDIMQTVSWVQTRYPGVPVSLIGAASAGVWALLVAALDDRIEHVITQGTLRCYGEFLEALDQAWDVRAIVPGILNWGDLCDVPALIAPRKVTQISPLDVEGRPIPVSDQPCCENDPGSVYKRLGAEGGHRIVNAGAWPQALRPGFPRLLND